ncbi:hypothetical protein [Olivibacter jilunii]|uniref:hypothetical protein n=1 Tax=Olivibacter jilunii TaxID=985016 RepID=UPI003F17B980
MFTKEVMAFVFIINLLVAKAQVKDAELHIGGSAQIRNFSWSIAGNIYGENPNILSELKYKDIVSIGYLAKLKFPIIRHLKLGLSLEKLYTVGGHGTDNDYAADNRTNPSYEHLFSSNKGSAYDLCGLMEILLIDNKKLMLSTGLSYVLSEQSFYILDKSIPELNSVYLANTHGPGVAVIVKIDASKNNYINSLTIWNSLSYKAEADWNLISTFKHPISFIHNSRGNKIEQEIILGHQFTKNFDVFLRGNISFFKTGKGLDKAYLASNNEITTRLNGAKSILYKLGIGCLLKI